MAEASIDLESLLSESPADPKPVEIPTEDQPETAATGSLDEPPESEPAPVETPEPTTLKALAEKAGIDLKDLYAAELADGTTLSAAADGTKSLKSLQTDREAFEQERVSFRSSSAQTLEHLKAIQTAITSGQSPEQAADALQQFNTSQLEQEQRLLLSVVPEWRDPSAKQADVEAMVAFAGPFGVTAEDLGQIRDHRYIAMLRFNALQAQRLKGILDGAEKPAPKGQKAGKGKPSKAPAEAVDIAALIKAAS